MAMPALVTLALLACGGDEPTLASGNGGGGGETTARCPDGMIEVAQDRASLGEWELSVEESYVGTVLTEQDYDLDAWCIGEYPLPGFQGQAWPSDGLSVAQLTAVEARLSEHGRRLCTVGELLYAAAGQDNWRHPYDAAERVEGTCDPDDLNPQPLGTYGGCVSPLGLRDLEVRSSWAVLDDTSRQGLEGNYENGFPGGGTWVAWGGTSAADTYYAPSNFGVHFHEEDEEAYTNNGLRICAEVGQVDEDEEAAWSTQVADLLEAGSFAAWLSGTGGTTGGTTGGDTGDTGG